MEMEIEPGARLWVQYDTVVIRAGTVIEDLMEGIYLTLDIDIVIHLTSGCGCGNIHCRHNLYFKSNNDDPSDKYIFTYNRSTTFIKASPWSFIKFMFEGKKYVLPHLTPVTISGRMPLTMPNNTVVSAGRINGDDDGQPVLRIVIEQYM